MSDSSKRVCVIDLGSNSARLSISEVTSSSVKTLYADKFRVKLSENMNSDMLLKEPAIKRSISVLKKFSELISEYSCDEVFAVATAAVRGAKNGEEFIKRAYLESGIEIKVISGDAEAKYDFLGVLQTVSKSEFIIMDIGGGSTEIIGAKDGELYGFKSLPIGSRRITEKYLSPETGEKVSFAEEEIFNIISQEKWIYDFSSAPIIGLGGCLKAVGKTFAAKRREVLKNNYSVPCCDVLKLYEHIKEISVSEREEIEGIGTSRGDIILGGLMPYMAVSKIVSPNELIISSGGIRDGIFFEYMNKMKNE